MSALTWDRHQCTYHTIFFFFLWLLLKTSSHAHVVHLFSLVFAGLCIEASSPEVFLLGCAALANMTFMDSMACDFLAQYHTARTLIEACTLKKAHTVFAKDQVGEVSR